MITHGIDEFMDDMRRTWCGIDLAPMVPRSTDDAVVDCMTCLVREARRRTVTDVVIGPDGTIDLETVGTFQ